MHGVDGGRYGPRLMLLNTWTPATHAGSPTCRTVYDLQRHSLTELGPYSLIYSVIFRFHTHLYVSAEGSNKRMQVMVEYNVFRVLTHKAAVQWCYVPTEGNMGKCFNLLSN